MHLELKRKTTLCLVARASPNSAWVYFPSNVELHYYDWKNYSCNSNIDLKNTVGKWPPGWNCMTHFFSSSSWMLYVHPLPRTAAPGADTWPCGKPGSIRCWLRKASVFWHLGHCHPKPKLFWSLILRIILIKTPFLSNDLWFCSLSAHSQIILVTPTGSDPTKVTLLDSSTLSISSFKFEKAPYTVFTWNPMHSPHPKVQGHMVLLPVLWPSHFLGKATTDLWVFLLQKATRRFKVEGIQN